MQNDELPRTQKYVGSRLEKVIQTQLYSLLTWKKENRLGTICLPTGYGKTRVGVLAAGELVRRGIIKSVLIIVPTTILRDSHWPKEFKKWKYQKEFKKNVDIMCIKSAVKVNKSYDLIIVDEIHRTLSKEYIKIHSIPFAFKLGLTATPPHNEEYLKSLGQLCPILYEVKIDKAVEDSAISEFKIFNIPVSLNRKERALYKTYDKLFNNSRTELYRYITTYKIKDSSVFKLAEDASKDKEHPAHSVSKTYWFAMMKRKQIIYNANNKIKMASEIINSQKNKKKWILFTKSIKFCTKLAETLEKREKRKVFIFHSKMSNEERLNVIKRYTKCKSAILCAVDALNEGVSVNDVDAAIVLSGVSTKLVNIQQLGRTVRFVQGKVALFINLYCTDTREKSWVSNKLENIPHKYINSPKQIQ